MQRRAFLKACGYGLAASVLNHTIGNTPTVSAANRFESPAMESRGNRRLQTGSETYLPEQLVETPFTLVEDFEDQTQWTDSGNVIHCDNAAEYATGAKSQKVTITAPGGSGYIRKNVTLPPGSPNTCRLRFYLHDPNVSFIYLCLYTGSSNYWRASLELKATNVRAPIGSWVTWDITKWTRGTGTPDWANGITRIRCEVRAKTGLTTSVSFDTLEFYGKTKPVLLLMADDGYQAVHTMAFPFLQQKNMVMTTYAIPRLVGRSTKYMSLSQLQEINAYGFDVANHTYNHVDLSLKTDAEIQTEWMTARDWLVARELPRAALHGVCPGGGGIWNNSVIDSTKAAGMSTLGLRRVVDMAGPVLDWYDVRRACVLGSAGSLSQAKAIADRCYAEKLIFPVLFHDLVPGAAASSTQWNITDFQNLIDYAQQLGFISLTISELYALRSGPLTVNHV